MIAIAPATPADVPSIARIYAAHVRSGTATFEIAPPDTAEIAARLAKVLASGGVWLAGRDSEGTVLGYAYAAPFRDRPAYRFTCENSIYIDAARRGQGIGSALLCALLGVAEEAGFRQMIAVIGGAEPASQALHARAGFTESGRMRSVGRKHGRWLDTLYMQRALGPGDETPPDKEPT